MAQRVEDIESLVKLINNEKIEIINKVNELNCNSEINEILNTSLPQLEKVLDEKHTKTLEQFSELNNTINSILSNQEASANSEEINELFSTVKTDINNFYNELVNQHNALGSFQVKLQEFKDDKSDRDDVIKSVVEIKTDIENFNRSLETSVIGINSTLQNILKNILTMDTTEQNDIIKRELENIFLSTNAILSSLEISDKKDDEMYNVISSVENKVDELIEREPVNAVKAINNLTSEIDKFSEKTSSEISKLQETFTSEAKINLEQILSNIKSSSLKIDELNNSLHNDFSQNLSNIKNLIENISIDAPSINPENPALSQKLEEILSTIKNIKISDSDLTGKYNIETDINILKNSLSTITENLNTMKVADNEAANEKLVALEVAISESIKRYDDNVITIHNKLNEYISSIYKLGEITDAKLDDSISGISELKFEIKSLTESLNNLSVNSDNKFESAIDSFKSVDEIIRQTLEEITNSLRINSDSITTKYENINNNMTSSFSTVNEKLDQVSNFLNTQLFNTNESFNSTSEEIHSVIKNTNEEVQERLNIINSNITENNTNINEALNGISNSFNDQFVNINQSLNSISENTNNIIQEKLNIVNSNIVENNANVNETLNGISNSFNDQFVNINQSLNSVSTNLNTLSENTNNNIQENINIVNETIRNNNSEINERIDNISSTLDTRLNNVSETLNVTSEALNTIVENTSNNIQSSINSVNEIITSNNIDLKDKLNSINTSINEQLQSIDESLSINTTNINSVSETINTSIQNGLNIISDELKMNSSSMNEKIDDINSIINTQLNSINENLNLNTENFNNKIEEITGGILKQLDSANQELGTHTTNLNATVEDLSISLKDTISEVKDTISTSSLNLNNQVESIENTLKEQLNTVNTALTNNVETINTILGNVNNSVDNKLEEISSTVKLDVNSVRECFDSALSALDMVRTDILNDNGENTDNLTELVNNAIKEIKELNSVSGDELEEKFINLREHVLAVILELQSRQEELISIAKNSDERNLHSLDDITVTIKNIESNLESNSQRYKQLFEEKLTELKTDISVMQQMLESEGDGIDEKILNKLFTVEALISEASDKYEEKITNLGANIASYIRNVQKNTEDAEIKLGNSVAEITEVKSDLQKIVEEINTVESNQDIKFYELTENLNSKIEDIVNTISGIKDVVQIGVKEDIKQNLSELDLKFENLLGCFNSLKELKPESIDQSFLEIEEHLSTLKQELNLVNTDVIEAIENKTTAIIENFGPVREAVSQILDFDFNKIITEVKTQVELSYLNLSSDLNSSLTMNTESISKIEILFKEVSKKVNEIDEQITEFSHNNLEVLNLTIENINKVVEKNLDVTSALSSEWQAVIAKLDEQISNTANQNKEYFEILQNDLKEHLNANLEDIKSFVSLVVSEEDIMHSLDIMKSELSNRIDILTTAFRNEFENNNKTDLATFSTDLKVYIDKILVNFAKHLESTITQNNGSNNKTDDIALLIDKLKIDLDANITREFDSLTNKLSDIQTTIDISNNEINKNFKNILNSDEKLHETLQALHDKVDILAMAEDSSEDIIYEIEEIKDLLNSASDNNELNNLLKEINRIEETSSKNANDIKESVMSAIISVFDQISFIEESEDIKDFVEEKTDEINHNIIEVRNQLKQLGYGDSFDYSYTLQDVESDIAKLRLILNEMSQSSSSDDMMLILDNIHRISGSIEGLQANLTTDQIYDLKQDVERLNEDIVSISTRTNKLLLTSDESYKALNNGLEEFSKVILQLEERINFLDNTKNSERIEKKLDNVNSMVSAISNSSKIMNQVMMYLGEWIDTTSENIGAISEKTSEIDEIKEIITDLKDTMPTKASILNELENRFEEQQQRIDRLEMKFDRVLALLEDREDSRLNKKLERIDKQMTKLSINIEKLASYVDE